MKNNGILIKKIQASKILFHKSMFQYYMLRFNTSALDDLEGPSNKTEHKKFFISLLQKYLENTSDISILEVEEYTASGLYGLDTQTMKALIYHMSQLIHLIK